MYLNRVYFGAGTYGIDAASRKYFNKSARNLNIFESAVLAGLLKAPSKYSPSNNPNFASERAAVVLKTMEDQGFIKSAKYIMDTEAKDAFSQDAKPKSGYMYFCDFAYEQAKKILGEIEDDIVVVTTFDEEKQKAAAEAIEFYMNTEGKNYNFSEASFICLGRNGAIKAIIGGKNYTLTQFNRATQASRLPGSAFKIFIYGAALEYGFQLTDMISDAPVSIAGWKPSNYKWKSKGSISVLDGFTNSVNSVSIRLSQMIGLKKVAEFSRKLGIDGVSTHDLSVALGTTPVTLKDLASSYTSFMDGKPIWSFCILEIRSKSGDILYSYEDIKKKPILDKELLTSCRQLLHSVVQCGTGRAAKANDFIYGKTGSNGNTDAWFLGFYDPENKKDEGFSFGVWIGNDKNSTLMTPNSTGGRIPARIINRFIKNTLNESNKKDIALESDPDEETINEESQKTREKLDSLLDQEKGSKTESVKTKKYEIYKKDIVSKKKEPTEKGLEQLITKDNLKEKEVTKGSGEQNQILTDAAVEKPMSVHEEVDSKGDRPEEEASINESPEEDPNDEGGGDLADVLNNIQ